MDFEKQKLVNDAYRKGWERIWGEPDCPREAANAYPNICPMRPEDAAALLVDVLLHPVPSRLIWRNPKSLHE